MWVKTNKYFWNFFSLNYSTKFLLIVEYMAGILLNRYHEHQLELVHWADCYIDEFHLSMSLNAIYSLNKFLHVLDMFLSIRVCYFIFLTLVSILVVIGSKYVLIITKTQQNQDSIKNISSKFLVWGWYW